MYAIHVNTGWDVFATVTVMYHSWLTAAKNLTVKGCQMQLVMTFSATTANDVIL
jgi:hypothetical protein